MAAMSVMALLPSTVQAQFTGFSAVMDTIWHADGADDIDGLEFYGSYSIYAEFTSATDLPSSLYSDVNALGTPAAGIEGTCGCFQSAIAASPWLWEINPALIPSFPDLQYSTGWTIGMYDSGAPGAVTPLTQDFAGPCEGFTTTNGAMFVVPEIDFETGLVNGPAVAVAGDDLKVLVARVTTCGEFTLQSCVQTFPGGDQSVESYVCAEPFTVIHPYQDGECLNDADGDGVCDEFEVLGCTDPAACNFDPEATQDDMSCEYAIAPYDCDGECVNDADGDGVCDEFEVEGCTGKGACNFDPNASDDDGTCFYPGDPCDDGDEATINDALNESCECEGEVEDGVEEATIAFDVYPSPVRDMLNLRLDGIVWSSDVEATILSSSGQVLRSERLAGRTRLDVSSLASGVYFLLLQAPSTAAVTRRFVVAGGE